MPNIQLQAGVPVELYSETGLSAGTVRILLQNNYSSTVKVSDTEGGIAGSDYINVLGYASAINKLGDSEAWVMAVNGGFINVSEA